MASIEVITPILHLLFDQLFLFINNNCKPSLLPARPRRISAHTLRLKPARSHDSSHASPALTRDARRVYPAANLVPTRHYPIILVASLRKQQICPQRKFARSPRATTPPFDMSLWLDGDYFGGRRARSRSLQCHPRHGVLLQKNQLSMPLRRRPVHPHSTSSFTKWPSIASPELGWASNASSEVLRSPIFALCLRIRYVLPL